MKNKNLAGEIFKTLFFAICVFSCFYFVMTNRGNLISYSVVGFWEEYFFICIIVNLSLLVFSSISAKYTQSKIGIIVFTISLLPFVLVTNTILSIFLGIDFFLTGFFLFFIWSGIAFVAFEKIWKTNSNSLSKIMGGIILFIFVFFVFFGPFPDADYFANAMIEKYPSFSEAKILKKEKGTNRDYNMIYLYTDTQGNQLECKHKESIFDSVLISLSRGDKVQIQYSTKYPEYCRFKSQ